MAVITFPGSNCDDDTVMALGRLGVPVVRRWYRDRDLGEARRVVLPGGFSYGDYLRSGALAARAPIMDAVEDGVATGRLTVLGICNGFQILCERGLLPGALRPNRDGRFRCTWEWVRVATAPLHWPEFRPGTRFRLPIAHREGAFTLPRAELDRLWQEGAVFLQYCGPDGAVGDEYNPNGSMDQVAGICRGRVMGLMPHPERAVAAYLGSEDGLRFLRAWLASEGE
ncbi:MAG: phosphoribosylformylglycinamidine synthase I [Firmicutes bacterium]|nr:phosphoribosylformylglycinamidine synthase I [Alicyclobacillaceae bacterium]MCL6497913.1 phosphoribosylformylglycinamidine synthase I [Bacillota bacterium]